MKKYADKINTVNLLIMTIAVIAVVLLTDLNLVGTIFLMLIIVTLNPFFNMKSIKVYHYLFSGILALLFTLGNSVQYTFVSALPKENFIQNDYFKIVAIFLFSFLIIIYILKSLEFLIGNENIITGKKFSNILFVNNSVVIFTLLLIFWLPYLLALYPGCVLPDSLSSINQALGLQQLSNHHPVLFTLFLKFFLDIFSFLGINKAIFIYTIVQTIIVASIITYFIHWLKRYKIKPVFRLLILSYFALAPVFPIYALNVQKDTLFASYLFLFTLKCIDAVVRNRISIWLISVLVFSGVLGTFYRNNGLYIILLMFIVLSIILIKQKKYRQTIFIFSSYFIITFLLINPLISRYSVPTAAAESLGVPLQQVSRVVAMEGEIDEKDRDYLNQLLPISEYGKYSPMLADSIKWNSKFNNKLLNEKPLKFVKVWAHLLPHNLKVYVDAYLLNTYGFWAPFEKNYYGFLDTRVSNNNLNIKQIDLVRHFTGTDLMQKIINNRNFLGSGTLLCLMIISFYLYWSRKSKLLWIGYLPSFLTWLSIMVATPVAFSLRYVFILAVSLPLFLCLPFLKVK